jgi:hypothetical protein
MKTDVVASKEKGKQEKHKPLNNPVAQATAVQLQQV